MNALSRFDALIVGGGPAGLSAALTLGRARKRVLLCDAGPRRNARAVHIQNFVTRDGTPPDDFRSVARAQLAAYPQVAVRDAPITALDGERNRFVVQVGDATVEARRIVLATGMVDLGFAIDGFDQHWGRGIYQCPYCHGWEAQDRPWGYLPRPGDEAHLVPFALMARGFTPRLTVFTHGAIALDDAQRRALAEADIAVETQAIAGLEGAETGLTAVRLSDQRRVACEALFAQPRQRQTALVAGLGLDCDADGYVVTDPMRRETSRPGIYAAGDLTTRMQSAINAAAMGSVAAAMVNLDLSLDRSAP